MRTNVVNNEKDFFNIEKQLFSPSVTIDTIKYNDKYCVNICNIGFDANTAMDMPSFKKLPMVSNKSAYTSRSHVEKSPRRFMVRSSILIILILEFFISSSTAKAIFVMGILSCVSIDLSKEMIVLVYLFGDGFTIVLYPTSPVLLIALSMIGMNYLSWLKNSKWLFIANIILVLLFKHLHPIPPILV